MARAVVRMAPRTAAAVAAGNLPKGDVVCTARLAAIQAAKRTSEWIPLAHSLALDSVDVTIDLDIPAGVVAIVTTAKAFARTGVEMEAMVGSAAGALCIYDMVKGIERGVVLERVELLEKRGGRTGAWTAPPHAPSSPPGGPPAGTGDGSTGRPGPRDLDVV